jgi:hypothetical protein
MRSFGQSTFILNAQEHTASQMCWRPSPAQLACGLRLCRTTARLHAAKSRPGQRLAAQWYERIRLSPMTRDKHHDTLEPLRHDCACFRAPIRRMVGASSGRTAHATPGQAHIRPCFLVSCLLRRPATSQQQSANKIPQRRLGFRLLRPVVVTLLGFLERSDKVTDYASLWRLDAVLRPRVARRESQIAQPRWHRESGMCCVSLVSTSRVVLSSFACLLKRPRHSLPIKDSTLSTISASNSHKMASLSNPKTWLHSTRSILQSHRVPPTSEDSTSSVSRVLTTKVHPVAQ